MKQRGRGTLPGRVGNLGVGVHCTPGGWCTGQEKDLEVLVLFQPLTGLRTHRRALLTPGWAWGHGVMRRMSDGGLPHISLSASSWSIQVSIDCNSLSFQPSTG